MMVYTTWVSFPAFFFDEKRKGIRIFVLTLIIIMIIVIIIVGFTG